jgi:uncharacterized protein (UPF0335 family)
VSTSRGNLETALRRVVARVTRIEDARAELRTEARDVYAEARDLGVDVPTLRELMRLKRMAPDEREAREELRARYKAFLGISGRG